MEFPSSLQRYQSSKFIPYESPYGRPSSAERCDKTSAPQNKTSLDHESELVSSDTILSSRLDHIDHVDYDSTDISPTLFDMSFDDLQWLDPLPNDDLLSQRISPQQPCVDFCDLDDAYPSDSSDKEPTNYFNSTDSVTPNFQCNHQDWDAIWKDQLSINDRDKEKDSCTEQLTPTILGTKVLDRSLYYIVQWPPCLVPALSILGSHQSNTALQQLQPESRVRQASERQASTRQKSVRQASALQASSQQNRMKSKRSLPQKPAKVLAALERLKEKQSRVGNGRAQKQQPIVLIPALNHCSSGASHDYKKINGLENQGTGSKRIKKKRGRPRKHSLPESC